MTSESETPSASWRLDGRVAVVTGGAGGIGQAISATLARAGALVIVADQSVDRARQVASDLTATGATAEGYGVDVTDEKAVEEMMRSVSRSLGPVRVLVNCAGIALRAPALEHTLEAWNRVLAVNVTGTFL